MKKRTPKARSRKSSKMSPKPPRGGADNLRLNDRVSASSTNATAFRIRLRGKDGGSLSLPEVRQGLLEAARQLKAYDGYRAKCVTVYLTLIDDDGNEVVPAAGEITLHPYKSAAEEFGI